MDLRPLWGPDLRKSTSSIHDLRKNSSSINNLRKKNSSIHFPFVSQQIPANRMGVSNNLFCLFVALLPLSYQINEEGVGSGRVEEAIYRNWDAA